MPRLDDVRSIVRHQGARFDEGDVPIGSCILRAVLDLDVLEARGMTTSAALDLMRGRSGCYDPAVLAVLADAVVRGDEEEDVRMLAVTGLRVGMVLLDAVSASDGRLLVAAGQEVSIGLLERLRNVSANLTIAEPLRVLVPANEPEPVSAS